MSTTTLQTDENEDLFVQNGTTLVILSGVSACAQTVRQATKLRTGENQFNINEGVDYFGTVFTPTPNYDAFRQSLISAIDAVTDVIDVDSLTISQTGDVLTFVANVSTIYGIVPVTNS